MSLLLLNLLIIVPIVAYKVSKRWAPQRMFSITGASFGAVIAPFSTGLYSWYFLSVIGVVPGMIGLILVMVHEVPGFQIALVLGLIPRGQVVTGLMQHTIVDLLNGIIWCAIYGLVGHVIDRIRYREK